MAYVFIMKVELDNRGVDTPYHARPQALFLKINLHIINYQTFNFRKITKLSINFLLIFIFGSLEAPPFCCFP